MEMVIAKTEITPYCLDPDTQVNSANFRIYDFATDQLGSVQLTVDSNGLIHNQTRYYPFGFTRWSSGAALTDRGFTGQRADGFGLMDYNARYYSPLLGRFISPDSMVPDPTKSLDWDRYAYSRNNPSRYTDPSGHSGCDTSKYDCNDPHFWANLTDEKKNSNSLKEALSQDDSPEPPTPITDAINSLPGSSSDWATAGTITDGGVLLLDLFADGVVVYATVVGFDTALPVVVLSEGVLTPVPVLSGGAAFVVADFFLVKDLLFYANLGATAATGMTLVSETKSGATVIETGQISAATKNSGTLTLAGWFAPEAISSTLIQGASFMNDLGWISFPFH